MMVLSKRTRFFLGHLGISALASIFVLLLVFLVWYPSPLADLLGVKTLLLLLIAIDVVIGPVLGLLVYKEGKKTLKIDLTIIILMQILAFTFGLYSIAQGRPAWIVYANSTMHLVKRSDVDSSKLGQNERSASWLGPRYVSVDAVSLVNHNLFSLSKVSGAQDRHVRNTIRNPSYYSPLKEQDIKGLSVDILRNFNNKDKVDKILSIYPNADAWVGLSYAKGSMVVLLDSRAEKKVLAIVDLRAW